MVYQYNEIQTAKRNQVDLSVLTLKDCQDLFMKIKKGYLQKEIYQVDARGYLLGVSEAKTVCKPPTGDRLGFKNNKLS